MSFNLNCSNKVQEIISVEDSNSTLKQQTLLRFSITVISLKLAVLKKLGIILGFILTFNKQAG